jgi:hypothetical protein
MLSALILLQKALSYSLKKRKSYFFELYFTRAKQMSAGRLSVRGLAFFSFRKRAI